MRPVDGDHVRRCCPEQADILFTTASGPGHSWCCELSPSKVRVHVNLRGDLVKEMLPKKDNNGYRGMSD